MENRTETIFISDGAECSVLIKNRTSGGKCNISSICLRLCLSLSNNTRSLFKIIKYQGEIYIMSITQYFMVMRQVLIVILL